MKRLIALGLATLAPVALTARPLPVFPALPCSAPAEQGVGRLASSRAQLAQATARKRAMVGTRGQARERARRSAIAAYRAVTTHWPDEEATCAEAFFRAGELLRAARRDREALAAFRSAAARAEAAGSCTFGARARLEIGHVHRRAGRAERALDVYLELARDVRMEASARDDATLWAGRVQAQEGRIEEARRSWRMLARNAEDPVDRIAAFDELALSWVEAGDLEAAAGVLELCRAALADLVPEETDRGERVRRKLERMRAVIALERAVAERRKGVVIRR